MFELKKSFWISCSHRLSNSNFTEEENAKIYGKCNNLHSHGHNYKITLTLLVMDLPDNGMVMNFTEVKNIFSRSIDYNYDHKFLNDCAGFENVPATAEHMAKIFYNILKSSINDLYSVEIQETEGASAIYYEGDDEC